MPSTSRRKWSQLATRSPSTCGTPPGIPAREEVKVVNYAERAKSEAVAGGHLCASPCRSIVQWPIRNPKRGTPEIAPPGRAARRRGHGHLSWSRRGDAAGRWRRQRPVKAQPWAVVTALGADREAAANLFRAAFAEAVDLRSQARHAAVSETGAGAGRCRSRPTARSAHLGAGPRKRLGEQTARRGRHRGRPNTSHPVLTAPLGDLVPGGQWGEAVSHPEDATAAVMRRRTEASSGSRLRRRLAGNQPGGGSYPRRTRTARRSFRSVVAASSTTRCNRARSTAIESRWRSRIPTPASLPQFLEEPETAKASSSIESAHRGRRPVVTIPDGHDYLAGPVDGGTRYSEPTAKILVTAIDAEHRTESRHGIGRPPRHRCQYGGPRSSKSGIRWTNRS